MPRMTQRLRPRLRHYSVMGYFAMRDSPVLLAFDFQQFIDFACGSKKPRDEAFE